MNRFGLLINRELQTSKRDLTIYAATLFLVLLASETMRSFATQYSLSGSSAATYASLFPNFLFLGGLIITSLSFADDMFSKNGQQQWLMLPATALEKFLSKGVLTAFAYPLALIVVFFLSSVIIEPIQ
ncbi:MAG TPA: hypothetical protein VJ854_01010, partial [Sphaerochaeta sp.]|nr:hypothetical protein [Sphaerochaeta sp.]